MKGDALISVFGLYMVYMGGVNFYPAGRDIIPYSSKLAEMPGKFSEFMLCIL